MRSIFAVLAAAILAVPVIAELPAGWKDQRDAAAASMEKVRESLAKAPAAEKKMSKAQRKAVKTARKGVLGKTGIAKALVPTLLANGEALVAAALVEEARDPKSEIAVHMRDMAKTYEAIASALKKGAKVNVRTNTDKATRSVAAANKHWKKVADKMADIGQVRADCQTLENYDKTLKALCPMAKAIDAGFASLAKGYAALNVAGVPGKSRVADRDGLVKAAAKLHATMKTGMQLPDPSKAPT